MARKRGVGGGVLVAAAAAFCWWATAEAFLRKPSVFGNVRTPPQMWMSTVELIENYGYRAESHEVRTADGYLVTIHRVRPARSSANNGSSPHATPVLVGHGLASNDEQWILLKAHNFPLVLADHGFDVWLGNYRGSFYGLRHVTLSSKSRKFWDFSWHENAVDDQAATIDYILGVTRRKALLTVGHSMSCTAQVILLAERPEYAEKILANVLMAPPVSFKHTTGFSETLRILFKAYPALAAYSQHAPNEQMKFMDKTLLYLCYPTIADQKMPGFCQMFIELSMGYPNQPEDEKMLLSILGHYPAGASVRQVMHYAQCITTGRFRQFDYGAIKNKRIYGAAEPPAYNLSRITSPMYVFYAQTDNLVNFKDAEEFARSVPSMKGLHLVAEEQFNHADFIISAKAYEAVYKHILAVLLKYV